jgi:hypothetical protein
MGVTYGSGEAAWFRRAVWLPAIIHPLWTRPTRGHALQRSLVAISRFKPFRIKCRTTQVPFSGPGTHSAPLPPELACCALAGELKGPVIRCFTRHRVPTLSCVEFTPLKLQGNGHNVMVCSQDCPI